MSSNSDEPSTSGISSVSNSDLQASSDNISFADTSPLCKKREGNDICLDGNVHEGDVVSGQGAIKVGRDVNRFTVYNYSLPNTSKIIPSIRKLKDVQLKFEKESYLLDVTESSYEDIQRIYPVMREARISEQDSVTTKELYIPSSGISNLPTDEDLRPTNTKELSINDILDQAYRRKILNLIGLPGAGKSTSCRRLAKMICSDPNSVCILVKFMDLNYSSDEMLTLRELLIDHNYPEMTENDSKSAFQWIVENEDKLLLILDGYDQANWPMKNDLPRHNYDKPESVCNLISNLYEKKLLPNCHILLTSRPHAVKTLPKDLRRIFTVHLLDLSFDDMKKLFFLFCGSQANELWERLHATSPQLVNLCGNPLLLQLVIRACTSPATKIGSITTLTRLFAFVLVSLNASKHAGSIDIRTVLPLLMRLAFNATVSNRVLMTEEDLMKVGLALNIVHHLIISQESTDPFNVFEGRTTLYFIHQTLQEYLTALYIHQIMSDDDFARFVDSMLFDSHWIVVRQFLFGITFDLYKSAGQQWKRNLLKNKLIQKMMEQPGKRDLIELCSCVRECADDDVIRAVAELFPTTASMSGTHISNSDAHALSLVLRKVRGRVEELGLEYCHLTSDSFRFIADAIKASACSFDVISMGLNCLSPTDVTIIGDVLDKINVRLWMWGCFVDGDRWWRNTTEDLLDFIGNWRLERFATEAEEGIIQERLNMLENWNLEVVVRLEGRKTLRKTA